MLDLVPLASAGRVVANLNGHARFIDQLLQFVFLQTISVAIAPAGVGGDEPTLRLAIAALAKMIMPAPNRLDRELGGVACNPDRNPCFVFGNAVNAVRNRLAQLWIREVMGI